MDIERKILNLINPRMKLDWLALLLTLLFGSCIGAEDYARKEDIIRLENVIKGLADQMASAKILDYAFKVNEIDVNLKDIEKAIDEIRQSSSKNCDCSGRPSEGPARLTDQSVKALLENAVKKIESYGNKLLPGHSLILKGQEALLQNMSEMKTLVQSGITKLLTSMSSISDVNAYIEGMEAQVITSIEDENAIVSKKQTILEQKLQKAADDMSTRQSEIKKQLEQQLISISDLIEKKVDLSISATDAHHKLTQKLISDLDTTPATTKCKTTAIPQSRSNKTSSGGSCSDLESSLNLVRNKESTQILNLRMAQNSMISWRKTMDIHCSKSIFRAYRLCEDADDFIKLIKDVKKFNKMASITSAFKAAKGFCKNVNLRTGPQLVDNKKVRKVRHKLKRYFRKRFTTETPFALKFSPIPIRRQ